MAGHASWDQLCPKFIEECKRAEKMDPEHSYKYFPAQEPWTWEQEGEYGSKRASRGACEVGGPGAGSEWVLRGDGQQLTQLGVGWDVVSEATGHGTVRQCRLKELPSNTHGDRAHCSPERAE